MKNKKGFTLIEIIISLAIITLIATITIVTINKKNDEKKLKEKYDSTLQSSALVYY